MSKLSNLIDEAIQVDREIEALTARLKGLKEKLVAHAEASEDEHTPGEGGGAVWTGEGSDGSVARVSFPVPTLVSKVDPEKKSFSRIKDISGRAFDQLFRPVLTYSLAANFRSEAEIQLGHKDAKQLVKLVTTTTKPRVAFETKQPG